HHLFRNTSKPEKMESKDAEMGFSSSPTTQTRRRRPHAVCVPYPAQSHVKASLKFAKLLHHRGFHITFVNTEFNHNRFLNSGGSRALDGLPNFRFATIPDGVPPSDAGATQDIPSLSDSAMRFMVTPFRELIGRLNDAENGWPAVSCVVADGMTMFAAEVAYEIGVPSVSFWTWPACAVMGFKQYRSLYDQGVTPFKDESYLTNGDLETPIEIPGMKNMRLKDLPTFIRTTDPNEPIFHNLMTGIESVQSTQSALLIHTFDALESDVVAALNTMYPSSTVYTVGPMQLLLNQIQQSNHESESNHLNSIGYSLWKEQPECLRWLDSKPENSVLYVNFGSIITMSKHHLIEFATGFINSESPFVWVIRPDLVTGESGTSADLLPVEIMEKAERIGFVISGWCAQEDVLNHPAVGGFLTHCGWASTVESLTAGVPMLCWPFFADQQMICKFACTEWGVGMEIGEDVKGEEVEELVKELMEGEKGKKMRCKARDWARMASEATGPGGSSSVGLDRLINEVLLRD
ncbi:(R)-mandelonitrile beta-glucosyltransferase, partial [Linum grandiflorum]